MDEEVRAMLRKAREDALEEAAKIADGAVAYVDIKPHRIKFISPEQYAADLARDIADAIRALATPPSETPSPSIGDSDTGRG